MIQFSNSAFSLCKARFQAYPNFIQAIREDNEAILAWPVLVPETAIATWNLYYFCPEHGVRLNWDLQSPDAHCCPVDGKIWRGEPWDGAWWRGLNGLNAKACYQLGLLWQLTGDAEYLGKVREILLGYAKYYPDYEVHGGIPCNGPGKANAQTLCEANCHLDFALGYDFIRDALSLEEQRYIEQRLLREGADFLIAHRARQLHNHEVKISATVGVIGLILGDTDYLEFAVNSEYGLRYQLEHGLLEEGLWFEGSVHYHFYALQGFCAFEKLARGTRWSLLPLPGYQKMLDFPLDLLLPDGTFPPINDCITGQQVLTHSHIYEFFYGEYGKPRYGAVLNTIYQKQPRNNLDALLYGASVLPDVTPVLVPVDTTHAPGAGLSVLRQPGSDQALLLKHSPFGGEHDHHDRLGIILFNQGHHWLPDLGTTGYGAPAHYQYYKNSATHNTLSIGRTNQPPAVPLVINWQQEPAYSWLQAEVSWSGALVQLDSHYPPAVDTEIWQGVVFRRNILWLAGMAVDVVEVENPHQQALDFTLHVDASLAKCPPGEACQWPNQGVDAYFHSVSCRPLNGLMPLNFHHEDKQLPLWLASEKETSLYTALAPANPATRDISYLVVRSNQARCRLATLYDLSGRNSISLTDVEWQPESVVLHINHGGARQVITLPWNKGIPQIIN